MFGADLTTFFPVDAANISYVANPSIVPTFNVVTGSKIVATSATVVGAVFPGDQITFSDDITVYEVSSVTADNVYLATPYLGDPDDTANATTGGGSDLTVVFPQQGYARRLWNGGASGYVYVHMVGPHGQDALLKLYLIQGAHVDGLFTWVDSSSTAGAVVAFA